MTKAGIEVIFAGEESPKAPQVRDLVPLAVGRSPNGNKLAAGKADIVIASGASSWSIGTCTDPAPQIKK